jgi:hypothetical protein
LQVHRSPELRQPHRDGSATIDGTTYPTVLPDSGFVSTIDVSGQTTSPEGLPATTHPLGPAPRATGV